MLEGIKIIDTDFTAISSLNGAKTAKVSENVIKGMKNLYYQDKTLNTSYYRMQAEKIYDKISFVKPIENQINDVIYYKSYDEKGIVLPSLVKTFKKAWTYYRLIYNEHNKLEIPLRTKKKSSGNAKIDDSYVLNNFDTLFTKLSKNISGVDLYVKELENMRKNITEKQKDHDHASKELIDERKKFEENIRDEKKALEEERKAFEKEKREELKKIDKANKELALRFNKLQELTDELNKKIASLTKK